MISSSFKYIILAVLCTMPSSLYAQNVSDFIDAAEQGNSRAQYNLGMCYVGERNWTQALYWIKKAADGDDVDAQYMLGTWYSVGGDGIDKDDIQAFYWWQKAANKGHKESQYNIGGAYRDGVGIEKDYSKALFWYQKSAEQGFSNGYHALAYFYANGRGVSADINKAHELIDKAISISPYNPDFLDSKGEFFLKENNLEKAKEVWMKLKTTFPSKVSNSVNDPNDVFCATMLKMELEKQNGIDTDIPISSGSASNTFAFIIANESYKRVSHVPFANNDGQIFAEYCKKTLGIPTNNVKVWIDATLADMKYVLTKIKQVVEAYDGEANIILYYAGHGIPSDDQQNSYLLPIDGYSADASSISLHELYSSLSSLSTSSVLLILDACFSGAQRNGEMFASTRGVAIKPKQENPEGNLIVLSAAQGDETALPYEDKNHGLFSYFLLKKLQESKGDCTIGELADYVTTNVKRTSISIGDKIQTPKISASSTMGDWRNIKLK